MFFSQIRGRLVPLAVAAAVSVAMPVVMSAAEAQEGYKVSAKAGKFEDVVDNLNDAIIKRGFVVDYTGELNKMLERTAKDTGTVTASGKLTPFKNAKFLQFCPAKLTHDAVNTNPIGIANCPIAIFVYELDHEQGKINVGYRMPVSSPSRKANEVNNKLKAVLADIVKEAVK
ncbi:MAG TPA: DUF302 domain-containing protein [Hyphomicrobiaceae bacterium]|nr:DUF302 domain-containing protein [Hyphomicrobiaceae bacterium]